MCERERERDVEREKQFIVGAETKERKGVAEVHKIRSIRPQCQHNYQSAMDQKHNSHNVTQVNYPSILPLVYTVGGQ